MQPMLRNLALPVTLGLVAPSFSVQAESSADLSGHAEVGAEYDSNVTVDEVNSSSGESDEAAVFDTGVEGKLKPNDAATLTLGYSLSGRRYQTLDQFDQNIHLLSADFSYDFDPVTLGTNYYYSHATLDSDSFLDFRRASVYVGSRVSDDVYLMASLLDKDKDFEDSDARDSDIQGINLDSFFFANDAKSYLLLGLDGEREDAKSDAFDNRLVRVRVAWVNKFMLAGEENRVRLSWRYEARDYDDVETSSSSTENFLNSVFGGNSTRTTEERADRARVVQASWRIGLNPVFSLEPSLSYGDYRSDLNSADYDKFVAGVSLRADF